MFNKSKKFIAVVLTLISLFGMCSMAATAVVEAEAEYPVIYLTGYGQQIFTEKGNHKSDMIYPTGVDVAQKVKENVAPILMELAFGSATGDYKSYCDALYNSVAPIYDELRLSPDGTVKDNSGTWKNSFNVTYDYYKYGMIRFSYDWRLSPLTLAAELDAAIDTVRAKYNVDKVNLLGRCYGSNIISAYLELYGEAAEQKINKTVLYIPSTMGIGLVGSVFSGKIELNDSNIDVYVKELMKYVDVMEDGLVKDFLLVMVSVFDQAKILNFGVEKLQDLIDAIKVDLIPRLVRDTYGSFLSFWSMVPDEYLADAVEFVYNTDELKAEYEGTINLINDYSKFVQKDAIENAAEYDNVYIISKYNLPSAPVFGKTNNTGDAVAEAYYTSFGATCAQYGSRLSASYIEAMDEEALKYLSPDEKIDASTCALPDKTWFIKNSYHDHFPESVDDLINVIFTTKDVNVFTYEEYPQYLDAAGDGETLTPVEGTDMDLPKPGSDADKFATLFGFIKFAIELLMELVKKLSAIVA